MHMAIVCPIIMYGALCMVESHGWGDRKAIQKVQRLASTGITPQAELEVHVNLQLLVLIIRGTTAKGALRLRG